MKTFPIFSTFLELHNYIIAYGRVPSNNGLCEIIDTSFPKTHRDIFEIVKPTVELKNEMGLGAWWAEDGNTFDVMSGSDYGPTRQNIVLLCAAINGEL